MMVGQALLSSYDVLLVDLYGVIWSGTHVFPFASDALAKLIGAGKVVIILSNASLLSSDLLTGYDAKGLSQGVHFTDFVTSGNVLRHILQDGSLSFQKIKSPRKYFVFGSPNDALFLGSKFSRTDDLEDADFVYISAPRFTDEERDAMSSEHRRALFVARTGNGPRAWDAVSKDPYLPYLSRFLDKELPMLVANPDKFAISSVLESPNSSEYISMPVVKQGLLAETYKHMGGEVVAIGKPFVEIYRYALERLGNREGMSGKRVIMVGDSMETDILGAKNASEELGYQIDSALVLTGISYKEMLKLSPSDQISVDIMNGFFQKKGLTPDHVLSEFSMKSTVFF